MRAGTPAHPRMHVVQGARFQWSVDRNYGDCEINPVCAAYRRAEALGYARQSPPARAIADYLFKDHHFGCREGIAIPGVFNLVCLVQPLWKSLYMLNISPTARSVYQTKCSVFISPQSPYAGGDAARHDCHFD